MENPRFEEHEIRAVSSFPMGEARFAPTGKTISCEGAVRRFWGRERKSGGREGV